MADAPRCPATSSNLRLQSDYGAEQLGARRAASAKSLLAPNFIASSATPDSTELPLIHAVWMPRRALPR